MVEESAHERAHASAVGPGFKSSHCYHKYPAALRNPRPGFWFGGWGYTPETPPTFSSLGACTRVLPHSKW